MIVECHVCEAKVDGRVIADHTSHDDGDPAPFHAALLECPQCKTTLLAGRYIDLDDAPSRLWPFPVKYLSYDIPPIIRNSLQEARACFKAGAYSACTVMAGRAVEGVCRHFGSNQTYIGAGIKELREKHIIDARLAAWARELQKARNLSAHASGDKVSRRDAEDLLQFVEAIAEYIFVLTARFDNYMTRRAKATGDRSILKAVESTDIDE